MMEKLTDKLKREISELKNAPMLSKTKKAEAALDTSFLIINDFEKRLKALEGER